MLTITSVSFRRREFEHVLEFLYLFNLAEDFWRSRTTLRTSRISLPKLPRQFFPVKVILFSELTVQMIGQAALPDLSRWIWNPSLPIV